MTGVPAVEFADLVAACVAELSPHPVGSHESALAMESLLDRYEGATLLGHDHPHPHVLQGFDVSAKDDVIEISVRATPCPLDPVRPPV